MEEITLSFNEAQLMYAELKLQMAEGIRKGLGYSEFLQFEKQLNVIDKVLRREEGRLEREIKKSPAPVGAEHD